MVILVMHKYCLIIFNNKEDSESTLRACAFIVCISEMNYIRDK